MAIYGKVETPKDIGRINCIIRDQMLAVQEEAQLTELKKRSDYLCTLTYSPFWKKKFGEKIEEFQKVAIEENRATVKEANIVAKARGWDKEYAPWRKDIDIEEQLKLIPSEVLEELLHATVSLKLSFEILELLREEFCDIRKALLFCEDEECIRKLKRGADILSIIPYLSGFSEHFDEGMQSAIDALIEKEKERTVELANILCEVKGFECYFEGLSEDDFAREGADEYLKKLLQEESEAETYIPSQSRYKGGGKVMWVVYYHPGRKREYAKRIYFPADFEIVKTEGPAEFKNRFGNKVWGLRILYRMRIEPTTIKIRGKEITLPERIVERSKIVPLPQVAQNVRIVEEKPKSAMQIS